MSVTPPKIYRRNSRFIYQRNSFGVAKRPTLDIKMEQLNLAVEVIKNEGKYRTTIHSHQGWHYQQNEIFTVC